MVGFGGVEMDVALTRGEIDARANSADTVVRRNADALAKRPVQHSRDPDNSKGTFHPRFANVPDADSLAKNDRERQLITLFREFMYPRWPYVLPPATPVEIVKTLRGSDEQVVQGSGVYSGIQETHGRRALASHRRRGRGVDPGTAARS